MNCFAICENDMQRNGNLGLKVGGRSLPRHIPTTQYIPSAPPPGVMCICFEIIWSCNRLPQNNENHLITKHTRKQFYFEIPQQCSFHSIYREETGDSSFVQVGGDGDAGNRQRVISESSDKSDDVPDAPDGSPRGSVSGIICIQLHTDVHTYMNTHMHTLARARTYKHTKARYLGVLLCPLYYYDAHDVFFLFPRSEMYSWLLMGTPLLCVWPFLVLSSWYYFSENANVIQYRFSFTLRMVLFLW